MLRRGARARRGRAGADRAEPGRELRRDRGRDRDRNLSRDRDRDLSRELSRERPRGPGQADMYAGLQELGVANGEDLKETLTNCTEPLKAIEQFQVR